MEKSISELQELQELQLNVMKMLYVEIDWAYNAQGQDKKNMVLNDMKIINIATISCWQEHVELQKYLAGYVGYMTRSEKIEELTDGSNMTISFF